MKGTNSNGCVVLIGVIVIWFIIFAIKECNRKDDYKNSSWYVEYQAEQQRRVDSMNHLNELAHSNPDEYNRIMQEHEEQLRRQKMWQFTTEKDESTHTDNVWATIKSNNEGIVHMPEPLKRRKNYSSTKNVGYCQITIRYMKKNGTEVLIKIPDIPSFSDPSKNYILVWFDSMSTPKKYSYEGKTKNGNVFLKKSRDFTNQCKKATHIKIRIPFQNYRYEDDELDFGFDVPEPLVWKYK